MSTTATNAKVVNGIVESSRLIIGSNSDASYIFIVKDSEGKFYNEGLMQKMAALLMLLIVQSIDIKDTGITITRVIMKMVEYGSISMY